MKPSKLRPDFFQRGGYSPVQFSSSEFIPVYAGAPLEETRRAVESRSALYHKNLADMTKLDIMNANRKVNPEDEEESAKITARLQKQMDEIAATGDYENQTLQVNQMARQYMNDPIMKAITESRAEAEKAEAFKDEMRRKGIPLVLETPASKHKTVTYDENGKPIITVYKDTSEGRLNYEKTKAEIAKRIEADKYPTSRADLQKLGVDLSGYFTTGSTEALTKTKVGQQLVNMVSAYKDTAEYRQEKAVAMKELQAQGMSAEEASQAADKAIGEELTSQALLRVYNKQDVDYVQDWKLRDELEAKRKAENVTAPVTPDLEEIPGVNVPEAIGFDIEDFDPDKPAMNWLEEATVDNEAFIFGEDRKKIGLKDKFQLERETLRDKGRLPTSEERIALREENKRIAREYNTGKGKEKEAAYKEAAVKGARIFAQDGARAAEEVLNGSIDKHIEYDYAKQYFNMVKDRMVFPSKSSYTTPGMDPALGETATKAARNNIGNRLLFDPESGEVMETSAKGKGVVNPEFMKLVGGDLKNMTVTGSINPKNPYGKLTGNDRFADAEEIQVDDGKGNVKTMILTKPGGHYKTAAGFRNKVTNHIWENLALSPGSRKTINIGGRKVEAMALPDPSDPSGASDRVVVFKLGDQDLTTDPEFTADIEASGTGGYVIDSGYDGLVNLILHAD